MQQWTFSDDGLAVAARQPSPMYLGGPPQAVASNFSTIWPRLRVPLQLGRTLGWQWHYSAGEGVVKLLNSPPLESGLEVGSAGVRRTDNRDMRMCLTVQSNTIADAP